MESGKIVNSFYSILAFLKKAATFGPVMKILTWPPQLGNIFCKGSQRCLSQERPHDRRLRVARHILSHHRRRISGPVEVALDKFVRGEKHMAIGYVLREFEPQCP